LIELVVLHFELYFIREFCVDLLRGGVVVFAPAKPEVKEQRGAALPSQNNGYCHLVGGTCVVTIHCRSSSLVFSRDMRPNSISARFVPKKIDTFAWCGHELEFVLNFPPTLQKVDEEKLFVHHHRGTWCQRGIAQKKIQLLFVCCVMERLCASLGAGHIFALMYSRAQIAEESIIRLRC